MSTLFRIEESAIEILNSLIGSTSATVWLRNVLDESLRDGTPIIVTDARGLEIG